MKNGTHRFIYTTRTLIVFAFTLLGGLMARANSDLVVTDVSWTPESAITGSPVLFSATIQNQGSTATPDGVIHGVLFSINGSPTTWSDTHTQTLAPGQSVTLAANSGPTGSHTWTPPTPGNYTISAWVDDINRIPDEANENNNILEETVTVTDVAPQPDLVVTDVSWDPENPITNGAVRFSATIQNQGTAATPDGVVHGVLFSINGAGTTWSDSFTQSLAPGQSVTVTANNGPTGSDVWVPSAAGNYTVQAWVDDVDRMPDESNEMNNTREEIVSVTNVPPVPDLVVTDVAWTPSNPAEGSQVTFSATIRNQGTGPTPADVIHGVRFSVDGSPVSWSDTHTTALAPGESVTLVANGGPAGASTWTAAAGNHVVEAWVDDIDRITGELDEQNNTRTAPLAIGGGGSTSEKFVLAHWMIKIGKDDANVRSIDDYKAVLRQMGEAGIDALVVYWDDYDEPGTPQCYADALTASEELIAAGIPAARIAWGIRGFADDPSPDGTDRNFCDMIIANKDRPGLFRDAQGRIIISGYYNAWNDVLVNYLRDNGVNFAYWPDQWDGAGPHAQAAAAAGATGWFRFFHGGVYDYNIWKDRCAAEKAAADAVGIGYMPPILPVYLGNQNAKHIPEQNIDERNWQMFESYGFQGLREMYLWAIDNNVPAMQIVSVNDYQESHHIQDFGHGGPLVGPDDPNDPNDYFWAQAVVVSHAGFRPFMKYYHDYLRTGTPPAITSDQVLICYRLHPRDAVSYVDLSPAEQDALVPYLPPNAIAWWGGDKFDYAVERFRRIDSHEVFTDSVQVCVRLTAASTVTLTCGSTSRTWANLEPGEHILVLEGEAMDDDKHRFTANQFGRPHVRVERNGAMILDKEASLPITPYIVPGNYNYLAEELTP